LPNKPANRGRRSRGDLRIAQSGPGNRGDGDIVTKTGRNEPCPCGSGKKYKKCCGSPENREQEAYWDGQRSISPDEYEDAFGFLADYFDTLMDSDKEAETLVEQAAWFDLLYEPGAEGGVPDSFFLPWLYLDVPFGKSEQTACERYMGTPKFNELPGRTAEAIRHMSVSYPAFYRTIGYESGFYWCMEMGTGRRWSVKAVNEDDLHLSDKGEVQYMRLAGPSDDACVIDVPWLLDDETAKEIEELFEVRWAETREDVQDSTGEEEAFRQFNKQLSSFWIGYINGQIDVSEGDEGTEGAFRFLNTEGHVVRLCEVVFKINRKETLSERLNIAADFVRDEEDEYWQWVRGSVEDEELPYTPSPLADLYVKRGRLVGETNSKERADRLKERLEELTGNAVSFKGIAVTNLDLSDDGTDNTKPQRNKKRKR
jgi:hypothetical protein